MLDLKILPYSKSIKSKKIIKDFLSDKNLSFLEAKVANSKIKKITQTIRFDKNQK